MKAPSSFNEAVDRRLAALPPRATGYAILAGTVLGMALYATFGPNDILTALIVGGVLGGIAAKLLIRVFLMGIEAFATRRMELTIVVAGLVTLLAIWYLMR